MKKENCLGCLFAGISDVTILMLDLTNNDSRVCEHPNSPYYKEYVDDTKTCRLYIDEKEYFENKDRKEKIDKLNDRIKFRGHY